MCNKVVEATAALSIALVVALAALIVAALIVATLVVAAGALVVAARVAAAAVAGLRLVGVLAGVRLTTTPRTTGVRGRLLRLVLVGARVGRLVVVERRDLGLCRRVVHGAPNLAVVRLKVLQVQRGLALLALEAELVKALARGRHQLHRVHGLGTNTALGVRHLVLFGFETNCKSDEKTGVSVWLLKKRVETNAAARVCV
jgi:hypothetical protein